MDREWATDGQIIDMDMEDEWKEDGQEMDGRWTEDGLTTNGEWKND